MMHIPVWLFWLLLSVACIFGCMLAGLLRSGRITQLEDENWQLRRDKAELASQLASAVRHPSRRHLTVVGQRNGTDR